MLMTGFMEGTKYLVMSSFISINTYEIKKIGIPGTK